MRSLVGYLVLDQPRQRCSHWVEALSPLVAPGAPMPLQVDTYFLASEDRALLGLWYGGDGAATSALVAEVARLAEIYVIDPACLSDPDRRVLQEQLASCEVILEQHGTVIEALTELVRRARELRGQAPVKSSRTITGRGAKAAAGKAIAERGAPAPPTRVTRGTSPARNATGRGADGTEPTPRFAAEPTPRFAAEPTPAGFAGPRKGATGTRNDIVAPGGQARAVASGLPWSRQAATRDERVLAESLLSSPAPGPSRGGGVTREGLSTAAPSARPSRERSRGRTDASTDPYLLAFEAPPTTFAVRFLRNGRWMPAQLSQLSIEGAHLAAGTPPRTGEIVFLALSFGADTETARGEVYRVSDEAEIADRGVASFHVRFSDDEAASDRLYELLRKARHAKAQLAPAPRRSGQRSALMWPVMLSTPRGSIRAEMLDVSGRGLFVHPLRELELEGNLGFSIVLEDQLTTVGGRAEVVRQLGDAEARRRGLRAGYGLEIADLAAGERALWEGFVARVRRRSGLHVLVGASPARFEEIAAGLLAAGYAVTGSIDPSAVAQLAELPGPPADAAVLDDQWAVQGPVDWMASILTARGVPCVTSHGDARRAYGEIDRLLGLVP
ncbi:MAG: PilZ domain-containing protein [Kofleriaceae bacterium]